MSSTLYVLYESATGYALFQRLAMEEIGTSDLELQKQFQEISAFSKMVKNVSFMPFTSPENALEESICIADGLLSQQLSTFLATALPKRSKKRGMNWELAVSDPKLGSAIREALGCQVICNDATAELIRCIRLHSEKLLPDHQSGDIARAQCGLGHSFSRSKVKFNVNRNDNMLIQASALQEHLDKGLNLLAMRVKEWYGWHFPELAKELSDPVKYSRAVLVIGSRTEWEALEKTTDQMKAKVAEIVDDDEGLADRIMEKAQTSMGGELAAMDWANIEAFATRVVALADYRASLQQYLSTRMQAIAPNLASLIGQQVGAKLISKAGSLTNLAKSPASTIQILGAEKALFRALKKRKGNTPKYGIIFHSSFIQRAPKEHRGKISRYLANKAALACRIDCFMENSCAVFGDKLHEQVEGRLAFFESGQKPQSNTEAMKEALDTYYALLERRERKRKKKTAAAVPAEQDQTEELAIEEPPRKKSRKSC